MPWITYSNKFKKGFFLTASGILFALGAIVVVGTASSLTLNRAITHQAQSGELIAYVTGCLLTAAGIFGGIMASLLIDHSDTAPPYDRYLVGTGYALATLALLNFTALFGFQWTGQLSGILCADFSCDQKNATTSLQHGVFLALLPGLTVLGALFFHANSLRRKRDSLEDGAELIVVTPEKNTVTATTPTATPAAAVPLATTVEAMRATVIPSHATTKSQLPQIANLTLTPKLNSMASTATTPEPFAESRFWAGLWFRIGEALLFALIVFLIAEGGIQKKFSGPSLLLLCLLLGMFVKSGETLIAGIADRTFNAIQAFVKP